MSETNNKNKIDMHQQICRELTEIYRKKNSAYGDSFALLRAEVPNAILVRVFDKYSRLKNLLNNSSDREVKQYEKDESIEDTLKDLANYCIMELVERQIKNKPGVVSE